jgi:hypothetical protein
MAANKTENLNMRVTPQTKQALRAIALREKRSMANALECLVGDYLERKRISITRLPDRRKTTSGRGG